MVNVYKEDAVTCRYVVRLRLDNGDFNSFFLSGGEGACGTLIKLFLAPLPLEVGLKLLGC